jgi:hypothetical protein
VRDEQVGRALETYVDQFVLSLDVEPPSASDIAALLGSHPDWTGGNVVLAGVIPTGSKTAITAIAQQIRAEPNTNVNTDTIYLITSKPCKKEA